MSKPGHWAQPQQPPREPAISGLNYDALQQCIHCGLCLEACPTYRQTHSEIASPRGRLALMRAVAEGQLPVDEGFADPINLCLGCRACESACPSGVPYGHLLEEARALTVRQEPAPLGLRLAMRYLLPYPRRLRLVAALVRAAQGLGLFRLLPRRLREAAEALPPLRAAGPPLRVADGAAAKPEVLFFLGCVQEALLPQQNRAALQVLAAAGSGCRLPEGQSCCGALAMHYGDLEGARALARRNIAAFEPFGGPVVNHAGGCGAHLKEYGRLLKEDPQWAARAEAFAGRVRDLSEWLAERPLPAERLGHLDLQVTYQDSCHLAHGQGVRRQPRQALQAIPGLHLEEMEQADQCCGSAGIYNLIQRQMAGRVLDEKMGHAQQTGAAVIVTANPGCYLQLCQGVRRQGLAGQVEVLSLAELLAQSLEAGSRREG